jgi:hypothetical protein
LGKPKLFGGVFGESSWKIVTPGAPVQGANDREMFSIRRDGRVVNNRQASKRLDRRDCRSVSGKRHNGEGDNARDEACTQVHAHEISPQP